MVKATNCLQSALGTVKQWISHRHGGQDLLNKTNEMMRLHLFKGCNIPYTVGHQFPSQPYERLHAKIDRKVIQIAWTLMRLFPGKLHIVYDLRAQNLEFIAPMPEQIGTPTLHFT